jgi:hypothetical protein
MTNSAPAIRRAKRWRPEEAEAIDLVEPQPTPMLTTLAVTPDRRWTSIVRYWESGKTAHCRLCPAGTCIARSDVCHLIFSGVIDDSKAMLVSSVGLSRIVQHSNGLRVAVQD